MKKVLALQKLQQLLDETVDNRAGSRSATENKTTTPGITEAKAEIHKKQKFQITLTPAIPKPKEPDAPEENQNLNKNMVENWHLIGCAEYIPVQTIVSALDWYISYVESQDKGN